MQGLNLFTVPLELSLCSACDAWFVTCCCRVLSLGNPSVGLGLGIHGNSPETKRKQMGEL